MSDLRFKYDEWIKGLNRFELTHLELMYMKEGRKFERYKL